MSHLSYSCDKPDKKRSIPDCGGVWCICRNMYDMVKSSVFNFLQFKQLQNYKLNACFSNLNKKNAPSVYKTMHFHIKITSIILHPTVFSRLRVPCKILYRVPFQCNHDKFRPYHERQNRKYEQTFRRN